MKGLALGVRAPTDDDLAFIYGAWVESFRTSHAAGPIPGDLYRKLYREIIRRVLAISTTLVVYNEDRPDQAFSFLTWQPGDVPVIHYCFTKQFLRRNGLIKLLLDSAAINPKAPFIYTFKSRVAGDLARKSWTGGRFDPLVARRATTLHEETLV